MAGGVNVGEDRASFLTIMFKQIRCLAIMRYAAVRVEVLAVDRTGIIDHQQLMSFVTRLR